ncbi:MAG: hypothetical protein PIR02_08795 [Microbacterium enclense]
MSGGVPADEVTANDFMQVRAALVRRVGGANEALVWTRIQWRASSTTAGHAGDDGARWWAATHAEIAAETGLTKDQARRAVDKLVAGGFLLSDQTEGFSRRGSYSPVIAHVADLPRGRDATSKRQIRHMEVADMPDGPSIETVKTKDFSSEAADAPLRGDVEEILSLLESEVERNGGKRPTRSRKSIDAGRLLIDVDGRTVDEISHVIRWCQADEFWRSNVLSMSKLREKFDQLRLAAQRPRRMSALEAGAEADRLIREHEAAMVAQQVADDEYALVVHELRGVS